MNLFDKKLGPATRELSVQCIEAQVLSYKRNDNVMKPRCYLTKGMTMWWSPGAVLQKEWQCDEAQVLSYKMNGDEAQMLSYKRNDNVMKPMCCLTKGMTMWWSPGAVLQKEWQCDEAHVLSYKRNDNVMKPRCYLTKGMTMWWSPGAILQKEWQCEAQVLSYKRHDSW